MALLFPATWIFYDLVYGPLNPEPFENALHDTGSWAVRLLLVTLAVTPLRRILGWNKLIGVRRMIGVSVLGYGLLHLGFYAASEGWDVSKVVSEITLRFYLTIGFFALVGLVALGATSFDAVIRKLGRRWNRLHKTIYAIGLLVIVHFFMQSKSDITEATLMAGLFLLLMTYRAAVWLKLDLREWWVLAGSTAAASVLTAGVEYAWYAAATNIPSKLVFMANFDVGTSVRPAVWIGIVGLVPVLAMLAKRQAAGVLQTSGRPRGGVS